MNIDYHKILQQLVYNEKDPLLFNSGFFLFDVRSQQRIYLKYHAREYLLLPARIALALHLLFNQKYYFIFGMLLTLVTDNPDFCHLTLDYGTQKKFTTMKNSLCKDSFVGVFTPFNADEDSIESDCS